jgi:hypothetical protein
MMNKQTDIPEKKATLIKIAIDMHLRNYRVVRQIDQIGRKKRKRPKNHPNPVLTALVVNATGCSQTGWSGLAPAPELFALRAPAAATSPCGRL